MDTELNLKGLAEHVRTGMPESLATCIVGELEKLDLAATFQWARCVVIHPAFALISLVFLWVLKRVIEGGDASLRVAHLGDDDLLGQLVGNHLSNIEGRGLERHSLFGIAIG